MINTYQTSLAPPPVPPRLNRSHPVLIPAGLPSPGSNKPLLRFLVGVVVLHLLLSAAGFIYLYHINMERFPAAVGQAALQSSEKQESYYKAWARMVVTRSTARYNTSGNLEWAINLSDRKNINYYQKSWLTVLEAGDYLVYSRVTFSKGESKHPKVARVMLREDKTAKEKVLTETYCQTEKSPVPDICTVTQVDVVKLQEGNQLSVWVEKLSQVDYNEKATAFGLYKL